MGVEYTCDVCDDNLSSYGTYKSTKEFEVICHECYRVYEDVVSTIDEKIRAIIRDKRGYF